MTEISIYDITVRAASRRMEPGRVLENNKITVRCIARTDRFILGYIDAVVDITINNASAGDYTLSTPVMDAKWTRHGLALSDDLQLAIITQTAPVALLHAQEYLIKVFSSELLEIVAKNLREDANLKVEITKLLKAMYLLAHKL
jgi:hypothetical protein